MTQQRARRLIGDVYQLGKRIGSGGMGVVYLGRHIQSQREVVIKVMHEELARDPTQRRRFAGEIDLLSRLRHPNVAALLDADPDHPQQPCLVQEFIAGSTLKAVVQKEGRLGVARTARLLGQLCQVLHLMHGKGILHRDLTAENLMLVQAGTSQEQLKLMDFGLASLGASQGVYLSLEKLTAAQGTIGGGTPDYVCPEQIRKETVDQRGDLYSVGVLLFFLLTGRLPFADAKQVEDILLAHLHEEPPSFASCGVADVPAPVETVVRGLLAKHPDGRPSNARHLAELFGAAAGVSIAAPETFPNVNASDEEKEPFADKDVLDRFEAWMPEQIAIMKLRGFLDQVGAEVLSSLPGHIRVRMHDPRQRAAPSSGGILAFLGLRRPALTQPDYLHLDLFMKPGGGRGQVSLTITLETGNVSGDEERAMRRGFGERICRELRSYLMVG